jgi:hypothetical protein
MASPIQVREYRSAIGGVDMAKAVSTAPQIRQTFDAAKDALSAYDARAVRSSEYKIQSDLSSNIGRMASENLNDGDAANPDAFKASLEKYHSDYIEGITDKRLKEYAESRFQILSAPELARADDLRLRKINESLASNAQNMMQTSMGDIVRASSGLASSDPVLRSAAARNYQLAVSNVLAANSTTDSQGLEIYTALQKEKNLRDVKWATMSEFSLSGMRDAADKKAYLAAFKDGKIGFSLPNGQGGEDRVSVMDELDVEDFRRLEGMLEKDLAEYERLLNDGRTPTSAAVEANRHVVNQSIFDSEFSAMKNNKGKKKLDFEKTSADSLLDFRERAQLAFKNDDISRDEFQKYMRESRQPLLDKVSSITERADDWYFSEPGASVRGLRVIRDFIEDSRIDDPIKQAYLYEEFYERAGKKYGDSSNRDDIMIAKKVAGDIVNFYLKDLFNMPYELEFVSAALNGMDLVKKYNVSRRAAEAPYRTYRNKSDGEAAAVYGDGTTVYQYGKKK